MDARHLRGGFTDGERAVVQELVSADYSRWLMLVLS